MSDTLQNKISNGSTNCVMTLTSDDVNWGAGWSINYLGYGNVPYNNTGNGDPTGQSTWNVKDGQENDYGNIYLTCDGSVIALHSYTSANSTYILSNIKIVPVQNNPDFTFSLSAIPTVES